MITMPIEIEERVEIARLAHNKYFDGYTFKPDGEFHRYLFMQGLLQFEFEILPS